MKNAKPLSVAVAMSGGVDSTVAAYLLQREGLAVEGVTLSLFSERLLSLSPSLQRNAVADEAAAAARSLGISHTVFDLSEAFEASVVRPFADTYAAGGTPNPCIACNRCLKFGALREKTSAAGCDLLATGHYARIVKGSDGRTYVYRAKDTEKDQTYMLWSIERSALPYLRFPLGDLRKSEVRAIAEDLGLTAANRPDSQDICFIPDGDYADFLLRYTGKAFPHGDFVDERGERLGEHCGIIHYTVGQRKGLGVALGRPMYVSGKDAAKNTVTLTAGEGLYASRATVKEVNLLALDRIDAPLRVEAKIRYSQSTTPATVHPLEDGSLLVEFDTPQRAVTPGQSFVMYDGDCLLGGGILV